MDLYFENYIDTLFDKIIYGGSISLKFNKDMNFPLYSAISGIIDLHISHSKDLKI